MGAGGTTVHPIGLLAVLICCVMVVMLPRKWAILPILVLSCFVAPAQRIVIASIDFSFIRILIMAGAARIMLRSETKGLRLNAMDCTLLAWGLVSVITFGLCWGTTTAVIFRLGMVFDALGSYVLFRCWIRDLDDVARIARMLACLALPVAAFFAVEWVTGRNMFSVFGGVPEMTDIRGGRLRCQGAFSHPILAGCFWASVLPLVLAMGGRRLLVAVSAAAIVAIVGMTSSSTPVLGLIFGLIAVGMYPLRRLLRLLQGGAIVALVFLHFAMNGPVWSILAKVNVLASSTGWHRYIIIDKAIEHVHEWWLVGTKSTLHWGPGLWDITNNYILEGVRGGLGAMLLLTLSVVLAFAGVGRLIRRTEGNRPSQRLIWAIGAMLLVHAMNFLAVSYFGQIVVLWHMALAIVAGLTCQLARTPLPRMAPAAPRPLQRVASA